MKTKVGAIELSINGLPVRGETGETVLEVAKRYGIYIPTLCYHEDLKPEGRCRLCLVSIKGFRALTTACTTEIAPGMEVQTETPQLEKVRRVTAELLLADHPADCLVCAQNLSCELQQVAAHLGLDRIRFRKLQEARTIDESNPFFVRDMNKCILCGRCVRTCSERQGVGAIDYAARGYVTGIDTFGNVPLSESECESCGECVMHCPSGALSRRDRRKPTASTRTVCPYCGTGCGLVLNTANGQIVSVDGDRDNPVNGGTLCVKGRFGQDFVHSGDRLTTPLIKRNGVFEQATWEEALSLVAEKFGQYKGDQFAAIGSSRCTNEENYVIQKFTRAVMGTNNVDNCARLCHAPTVTGLSTAFGTGGGTNPLEDIEGADCLFVVGSNTSHAHPVAGGKIRRAAQHATLIVVDPREIGLVQYADLWLRLKPGTDVPLLMGIARVIIEQKLHNPKFIAARTENFEAFQAALEPFTLEYVEQITTVPKEQIVEAARLYAKSSRSLLIYSLGITEHSHGTDNVLALANLALLTGNVGKPSAGIMPMRGQNNVQGACDMGCIPGSYQGYQPVAKPEMKAKFEAAWGVPLSDKPGLSLNEFFYQAMEGQVKALYCVGMDPAYSMADINHIQAAFRKLEFVVFQDIFLTGSAEFADVVLPGVSFAEKTGTFTNAERRVQLVRQAIPPVGDARQDWWITCEIARRMGASGFDFADSAAIMDEIAELTPYFAGFSLARLDKEGGIQWPCTGKRHAGTTRLHTKRFNTPTGKGHFSPLEYRPSADQVDAEYPILLTTGRSLYHFHLAMTTHVPGLMQLHPEELIWVHPEDAARLGVSDGEMVQVSSRRGTLQVKAKVTEEMQVGQAFMTFHFYRTPTNVLTRQALDPVSKTPEFKVTAVRIERVQ